MEYTIITPTGDRPQAFEFCRHYVWRQSVLPKEWIVVDDGVKAMYSCSQRIGPMNYIRRQPHHSDPAHTIRVQMLAALEAVTTNFVLIFEDDDWYHRNYAAMILSMLESNILAGFHRTIYYHVQKQCYRRCFNENQAAFCHSGFRSTLIPLLIDSCERHDNPYIDLEIWNDVRIAPKKTVDFDPPISIGMKGLPGRRGQTSGHFVTRNDVWTTDHNLSFLQKWIGLDIDNYKEFIQNAKG